MRIDTHQHFWKYDATEYGWIDDSMTPLRKDFLPADLEKEMPRALVDAVIAVQARQSLAETRWLLELAERHAFIQGVVGWAPLASKDFEPVMADLLPLKKLRGLRHVVQGEAEGFLDGADFNRGVSKLRGMKLAYDILIFERQLPKAIRFVDHHPDQVFILDHVAKPRIKDGLVEPWAKNLRELARRPRVFCKLSGLVTEADVSSWTEARIRTYLDVALEAFGPKRILLGSDWPVCTLGVDYAAWFDLLDRATSSLSADEKDALNFRNARIAYDLPNA